MPVSGRNRNLALLACHFTAFRTLEIGKKYSLFFTYNYLLFTHILLLPILYESAINGMETIVEIGRRLAQLPQTYAELKN